MVIALAVTVALTGVDRELRAYTNFAWTGFANDGNFTTNSNWFPNSGYPNSTTSAASIAASGTYGVKLTQSDTLDTLLLNAPGLTFNQSSGTTLFAETSMNVAAGVYNMLGSSSLICQSAAAGTFTVAPAATVNFGGYTTLYNYNLGNGTTLTLTNGLNTELVIEGSMNCVGSATINAAASALVFAPIPSPAGHATINHLSINLGFGSITSGYSQEIVTLGAAASIQGCGTIAGNELVNQGTITANNTSGQTLYINPSTFMSSGKVSVVNGGSCYIESTNWSNSGSISIDGTSLGEFSGNWSNTGTVSVAPGGSLYLFGTYSTSSLSGFSCSGATVLLDGSLQNSNATLTVDGNSLGNLSVDGAITGGTVHVTSGKTLQLYGGSISSKIVIDSGSTLNGFGTLGGGPFLNLGTIQTQNGTLTIDNSNTLSNQGTLQLSGGTLYCDTSLDVGEGTLVGSGNITATTLQLDNDPSTLLVDSTQGFGIDVTGNVVLGGNLVILYGQGTYAAASTPIDVMTVNPGYSLTGSFLDVSSGGRLEAADGTGSFGVDYGGSGAFANEIVLSNFEPAAVPEPAAMSTLILSTSGLALRRRVRRKTR